MPKTKEPKFPEHLRKKIKDIFDRAIAEQKDIGMCDYEGVKDLRHDCEKWNDFEWLTMGMQLGILP